MTRNELIARINAEVSTYLESRVEMAGLGAYSKVGLAAIERGLGRMIEIQAQARAIESKFSRNQIDYMCLSGNKDPEYVQAEHLFARAQRLWHAGIKALLVMDAEFGGDWSKYQG